MNEAMRRGAEAARAVGRRNRRERFVRYCCGALGVVGLLFAASAWLRQDALGSQWRSDPPPLGVRVLAAPSRSWVAAYADSSGAIRRYDDGTLLRGPCVWMEVPEPTLP